MPVRPGKDLGAFVENSQGSRRQSVGIVRTRTVFCHMTFPYVVPRDVAQLGSAHVWGT